MAETTTDHRHKEEGLAVGQQFADQIGAIRHPGQGLGSMDGRDDGREQPSPAMNLLADEAEWGPTPGNVCSLQVLVEHRGQASLKPFTESPKEGVQWVSWLWRRCIRETEEHGKYMSE